MAHDAPADDDGKRGDHQYGGNIPAHGAQATSTVAGTRGDKSALPDLRGGSGNTQGR
jgi:hypothetical protein